MLDSKSLILIDWLTFSSRFEDPFELVKFLHLEHLNFLISSGGYGYKYSLRCGHISILYDNGSSYPTCVNLSGQGCREFEDSSDLSFFDLFKILDDNSEAFNITRLDVAFDERDGLLDINRIAMYIRGGWYVSRSRYWVVTDSSKGTSCEIGSPKSDYRIRIYDKASERGYSQEDNIKWVRIEMQLRDDRAVAYVKAMLKGISSGELFSGVLNNYLRFVEFNPDDSNKSRWIVADWWDSVIADVVTKIKLYSAPGAVYNTQKLRNYVIHQAGSAVKTYCQLFGVDSLINNLVKEDYSFNSNYASLLDSFRNKGINVDRDLLFDQYGYILDTYSLPFKEDKRFEHIFSFADYKDEY